MSPRPDRLARRYRRLLLAHPRWYRRQHGADMLTALLDAAPAGPAHRWREAALLVGDGLRARFRVRGPALLVAALAAVVGAGLLGAAGGWAGWQAGIAPYPTVAQATTMGGPTPPAGSPESVTLVAEDFEPGTGADQILISVLGDPDSRTGGVTTEWFPAHRDTHRWLRDTARGLAGRGWRVRQQDGTELVAERSGYRLDVIARGGPSSGQDDIVVIVAPAPPAAAYRLGWAGAALGLLVGWLVAAAAVARAGRRGPPVRVAATGLAVVGLLLSLPAVVLTAVALATGGGTDPAPPWVGYHMILCRPAAILGGAALAAALLLLGAAREGGLPGATRRAVT